MKKACLALIVGLLLTACGGAAPAVPGSAPESSSGAQASPASASLQAVIDGARREGQITLVWGEGTVGGSEGAKQLVAGLNKRFGLNITLNFTLGPSMPDMGAKILQEFQTNRSASSDVFIGSEAPFPPLMAAKALEAIDWGSWAPDVKDANLLGVSDGQAAKITSRTPGITYNSSHVSADAVPKTMQDLLKPEFKGRIASTTYGAMFDRLASDELWGGQTTIDYVTKLSAQVGGLIRCGEIERIASGEFDLFALDCGASDALRGQSKGAPTAQFIPTDAAALVYWYAGVPKNAAHPNAAKLFIDYLMSREGQDIEYQTTFEDQYMVPGSHSAGPIDKLKAQGVTFHDVDIAFVLRNDPQKTDALRQQIQGILAKK